MNFRLFKFLVFTFILLNITTLNGQDQIQKKYAQPFAINTDLFRLVSYESENSVHVGLSKSNFILRFWGIELDFYKNESHTDYDPHNKILDVNLVCKTELSILTGKQFFVSGGTLLRNLYLVGLPGKNRLDGPPVIYSYNEKAIYKLGFGTSLSVSMNISNNLFIENSFKFGIYFLGKTDQFYASSINFNSDQDGLYFFNLDILRFGYKFQNSAIEKSIEDNNEIKYGVSINMFRFLKSILNSDSNSGTSYSLSLSCFSNKQNIEIEIPIYINNFYKAVSKLEEHDVEPGIREVFHVGMHLKKYFFGCEFGTYLCGFVRYCNLKGELDTNNIYSTDLDEHSVDKVAIGLGAGYKYFLSEKWYLDFYLQAGKYVFGENNVFPSSDFDNINNNEFIHEIGSLKIGYRFSL